MRKKNGLIAALLIAVLLFIMPIELAPHKLLDMR